MKKLILFLILSTLAGYMVLMVSCDSGDDFETENTFNLDTLYVNPSSNINQQFQVIYEVSTTGFPQFLIDIYLSDDQTLDSNDLLLAETADTDVSSDADQSYISGINFRISEVEGGSGLLFEYSFDLNTWEGNTVVQEPLSGETKFIIGRFYHVTGLQIEVGRSVMADEVSFQ